MVFGIGKAKSKPPERPVNTKPPQQGTATEQIQSTNNQNSNNPINQLHNAPTGPLNPGKTESIKFRNIEPHDPWLKKHPHARKILKRFKVGHSPESSAVLNEKEDKLVIISNGPTAFKELFNNKLLYKTTAWIRGIFGTVDKDVVGKWDKKEIKFSKSKHDPQAKVLEPLKHIRSALKKDEYKVVSIFNKEGDKFEKQPSAIALIDSYEHLIDSAEKYASKENAAAAKAAKANGVTFKGSYATDQYLANPESKLELSDITHTVAEAFYQGHGFEELTLHYQVHNEPFTESDDLAYQSIPWKHIYQRNDGNWKTSDDTHPASKITLVKPKDKARLRMNPEMAYVHGWSQISEGKNFNKDVKTLELVTQAEEKNRQHISELNRLLGYNS